MVAAPEGLVAEPDDSAAGAALSEALPEAAGEGEAAALAAPLFDEPEAALPDEGEAAAPAPAPEAAPAPPAAAPPEAADESPELASAEQSEPPSATVTAAEYLTAPEPSLT